MDFASSTRAAENKTRWKEIHGCKFICGVRTISDCTRIE